MDVPQQLNLLEEPIPAPPVWQHLTTEQRATVIGMIARIIRKAVVPLSTTATVQPETSDD